MELARAGKCGGGEGWIMNHWSGLVDGKLRVQGGIIGGELVSWTRPLWSGFICLCRLQCSTHSLHHEGHLAQLCVYYIRLKQANDQEQVPDLSTFWSD